MTTLSIFSNEITDLEAQISAFQARLTELQQAEFIAQGAIQALTGALAEFEKLGALPKFKSAVLNLLGGSPSPDGEPKFENFVTEVLPKQLTISEAIAETTTETEATPAPTVEVAVEQPEQMNHYIELVQLTPTLAYQKRHNGEIVCCYLGCGSHKYAKDWQEQLELWNWKPELRKPKRLTGEGIRYEIKFRDVAFDRLQNLAAIHTSPNTPVPHASSPKKPQGVSISPTTSSENCETQNDAIAAVPSAQQNDWQPRLGDRVRIAEMIGEYRLCSINGKYATARRTDDGMLVTGVALADCTPVLVDEPEIQFAFRQTGDSISADFEVFVGSERIGKTWEHLTQNGWNHSLNRNPALSWPTREDAALALHASYEANKQLHQSTNDALRAKYGLAS